MECKSCLAFSSPAHYYADVLINVINLFIIDSQDLLPHMMHTIDRVTCANRKPINICKISESRNFLAYIGSLYRLVRIILKICLQNSSAENCWNQISSLGPFVIQKRYLRDNPCQRWIMDCVCSDRFWIITTSHLWRWTVTNSNEPPTLPRRTEGPVSDAPVFSLILIQPDDLAFRRPRCWGKVDYLIVFD